MYQLEASGKQTPLSVQRRHFTQSAGGNQSQRNLTQPSSFMQSPMHDGTITISGDNGQVDWGTNINQVEMSNKFERFLLEFKAPSENDLQIEGEGEVNIYAEKLNQMAIIEEYVLKFDGQHLFNFDNNLYQQLILFPSDVILIFDKTAERVFKERFAQNESQLQKASQIRIQVVNIKTETHLRDIRPQFINRLVSMKCIIIRVSDIYPEMKGATFKCIRCNNIVLAQIERACVEEPNHCEACHTKNSFQLQHNLSYFTDKQYIKVQELPETVLEGETPQTSTLMAYDEQLVDHVRPGDKVEVVGIYRALGQRKNKNKSTLRAVYNTYLDVISFQKLNKQKFEDEKIQFSEETQNKFFNLADRNDIYDLLVKSIAPSIWEYEDVKKGVLCQLFGGCSKIIHEAGQSRTRSEINCLLVGDPSVAKSQMLKYVNNLAPRGIYTSGKGSSAVGLTAYVTRDPDTKEIILESGALVLSDLGICCIDEFDKMDDNTRTILHEAMEQQSISIAKAGIVASLNARTAILAGANPIESRYNARKSVIENINLQPSLLSRFDLIYLLLDKHDAQKDKKLANHILNLYSDSNKNRTKNQTGKIVISDNQHDIDVIDKKTLQQYITFARQQIQPKLSNKASNKLIQGYVQMRKVGVNNKVITSTTRQLESLIRISESLAKMRLSSEVTESDVDEAIRLMQVATQSAATDPSTGLIDMDMITTGITAQSRQRQHDLCDKIRSLIKSNQGEFMKGISFQTLTQLIAQKEGHYKIELIDEKDLNAAARQLEENNIVLIYGSRSKQFLKIPTLQDE